MIETFDLAHVGRAPARFDFAKLENMNGHYMRASRDEDLLAVLVETWPHLPDRKDLPKILDAEMQKKLLAAMPGLKERAKTLVELRDGAAFLFAKRPLVLDDQAGSILESGGRMHLGRLLPRLAALQQWTPAATEAVVRNYAEEMNLKLGQVAQPLRAALTGRATSLGIFDVLDVLGREESLARLQDQIP
jgi:glutamyl-tRNA synthetase